MNDPDPLFVDEEHAAACHERWSRQRSEREAPIDENGEIPDEWYNEQCGQCIYYIPLVGNLASDWGLCSNSKSSFDGKAVFEHYGCEEYVGANCWVTSFKNCND
jgi:hypothetical protein